MEDTSKDPRDRKYPEVDWNTTKELYKIIDDNIGFKNQYAYNLKKVRDYPAWKVKVFRNDELMNKGAFASYSTGEINCHYGMEEIEALFNELFKATDNIPTERR